MSEHSQTLMGEGEAVRVDQRALIDKVLARYPGEFTLFRELLQNSDDAESEKVEIHFKSAAVSQQDRQSSCKEINRWTFKNNGRTFTKDDWKRLTRIALGNPDPRKVGAFGVGFYSLFSVTQRPVVTSGDWMMTFYWNGDQLYFLKESPPKKDWTVFEIPLRVPAPMPSVVELMQFLTTSITFMEHLKDVQLFLDDDLIGHVQKYRKPYEPVSLPAELKRTSFLETKTVDELQCHQLTIRAGISTKVIGCSLPCNLSSLSQSSPELNAPSFSAQTGNHTGFYTKELDLTVFAVEADVTMSNGFLNELSRCMGKNPPSRIKYSLVYTGKDQSSAGQERQSLISIFQELHTDSNQVLHPKIFIGHSTSQTTGIGGDMASQFIPTVERESIDLADRNVTTWNSTLLYIGGFLSRAVYERELSDIQTAWTESSKTSDSGPLKEFQTQLCKRFIHLLDFFTFRPSTPSSKVADQLQHSFYTCSASPLMLLSSLGVRPASEIRSYDRLCAQFVKHIPMLATDVMESGKSFLAALPNEHKIQSITPSEVLRDLNQRILNERELVAYLEWLLKQNSNLDMAKALQAACFRDADGTRVSLSSIQYFVDSNGLGTHIPLDGPLPPSLIPRQFTRQFTSAHLAKLRWQEFTIVDWLGHISDEEVRSANPEYDFSRADGWAERVLRSASLAWSSSSDIHDLVKLLFMNRSCIPTTCGLCSPKDSYLPSSNILASDDDRFPIVCLPSGDKISEEMGRLLKALGVRQHLPPQVLMRMVQTGKWKTSDLLNYLIPVAKNLTETDIHDLNSSEAFEGVQEGTSKTRFYIKDLYPPLDSFQRLYLPIINLGESLKWQDSSPEAVLLYRLGLNRFPSLEVIMDLCSQNRTVGANAFDYLCTHLRSQYLDFNLDNYQDIAFVPAENNNGSCFEKPEDVFIDKQWKTLGFSVMRATNQGNVPEELGVQRHPPSSLILNWLKMNQPSDEQVARQWFEILSDHVSRFSDAELSELSQVPMVPRNTADGLIFLTPVQCYLEKKTKPALYSKLFHFVNFSKGACQFLRACGAKDEPTDEDVAISLVEDPKRFYEYTGPKRFLEELRELAFRCNRISNDTKSKMRNSPVLLGIQSKRTADADDTYLLRKPGEIIIVDDEQTFQLFADSIITAPRNMSHELEEFYVALGCHHLTKVVRDRPNVSGEIDDSEMSLKFRKLVLNRLPLFLHNYPHPKLASGISGVNDIDITVCEELTTSQMLTIGDKKIPKERSVSATAAYEGGMMQLWLTNRVEEDMLELAVSLCWVLLGTKNRRDAEFLKIFLSRDRNDLERGGYRIDQVYQCSQCRDSYWFAGVLNPSISPSLASMPLPAVDHTPQLTVTDKDPNFAAGWTPSATNQPHSPSGGSGAASGPATLPSTLSHTLIKVVSDVCEAVTHGTVWSREPSDPVVLPPSPWDSRQVMPQSYIQSTVKRSIQACNSRQQTRFRHHTNQDMREFLGSKGYCDTSPPIENLQRVGRVENMDVYVSRGTTDVDTFMERMQELLAHFVRIITQLSEIYQYPMRSLRIFYDNTPCIAFNCKGTLYLNLRYFEAWHFKKAAGRGAVSFWFLTLAHEIAHNLVVDHNSEHEFWFGAICDAHMDKFSQLLSSDSPGEVVV